jgi:hypothetical protein
MLKKIKLSKEVKYLQKNKKILQSIYEINKILSKELFKKIDFYYYRREFLNEFFREILCNRSFETEQKYIAVFLFYIR